MVKGDVVETAKENYKKDKVEEEHETNPDWMKYSLVCRQRSEEENWKWFEDLGAEYWAVQECPPGNLFHFVELYYF